MKRIVVISDLHCGHQVGLTPPQWMNKKETPESKIFLEVQQELWKFYVGTLKTLQPINILVINGDAIEGKGEKSGGTELNIPDRTEQCKAAVVCIRQARAQQILMTFGTSCHTGKEDDFENTIAEGVGATIKGEIDLLVNKVGFNFKHHIGGSNNPSGRATALERERVWNRLHFVKGTKPLATVMIRSHVHAYTYTGDADGLNIKTPALQAPGSKYGARNCIGTTDIGLLNFDVENNGEYIWGHHLLEGDFLSPAIIKG